ncbi:MAG TPA: tRNA (adenosine(37)-N6)-threonylcarbamoyltransferase complex dimerization subunit type 1 TsaB [Candidatus Sulfotelmatobacter sp.]
MIVLSVDTSGKQGSIALARADSCINCDVIETAALEGGTFSAQLVPQIASLLTKHGFSKSDIEAFVVVSGPGSFTGLRVGLAVVKALAEALKKPIAAVSLLETIAIAAGWKGRVIAALDAGRDEAYVGQYEVEGDTGAGMAIMIGEELLTQAELFARVGGLQFVTTDSKLSEAAARAGVSAMLIGGRNAGSVAALGWRKIIRGEIILPEDLEANYIRRTDAELLAKCR